MNNFVKVGQYLLYVENVQAVADWFLIRSMYITLEEFSK